MKELKWVPEQFVSSIWLLIIHLLKTPVNANSPCTLPFKLLVMKDSSKWVLDTTKLNEMVCWDERSGYPMFHKEIMTDEATQTYTLVSVI
jgi:hypothetical protein